MNQPAWTDSDDDAGTNGHNEDMLSDRLVNISMSENDVANCRGCSSDPEGDEGPRIAVHLEPEGGEGDDGSELDGGEDEDKAIGGRYFAGGTGGNQRCFNCGLPGHFSKECPETNNLPCFLCGGRDHQRKDCPEEICYNCGGVGHMSKECSKPRKRRMFGNDFCNRCGLPGHIRRDCSLSWRRYVFVREPSAFEVERAITMLAPQCYNCAAPSHYGDECPHRRRAVEWSIFHTPNLEFLQQASHLPQERQARASPKRKYEGDQHPPPPHRRNYIRGEREEERDRGYYRSRERGDSSSRRDHGRRHHEGSSYAYHRPTREHVTERRDETVYRRHSLAKERDVLPQSHHYHSDSQQSESRKGVSVPGRGHFRKQSLNPEPRQPQVEPPTLSPIISRRRRG